MESEAMERKVLSAQLSVDKKKVIIFQINANVAWILISLNNKNQEPDIGVNTKEQR